MELILPIKRQYPDQDGLLRACSMLLLSAVSTLNDRLNTMAIDIEK